MGLRLPHLIASLALAGTLVFCASPAGGSAETRKPVLVELFTSEGCSSCPPADALLARLVTEQPIAGVEVVALGLHVDYWNRLGWVDPFSKAEFTNRQNDYASIWGVSKIYTPQAVVDGAREFVGNDWSAAREYITAAAAAPKVPIAIEIEPSGPGSNRVSLRINVSPSSARASKADVTLAVTEDGLVSDVRRGENADRTLSHVAVVRVLQTMARVDAAKGLVATQTLRLDPAWRAEQLRLVVFMQDPVSHSVLGVATLRLGAARRRLGV